MRVLPGAATAGAMIDLDETLAPQTLKRLSSRQIPELVAESLTPLLEIAGTRLMRTNSETEHKYSRRASKIAVERGGLALHYPVLRPDSANIYSK
ncbi:hypothetical protein [Paraburkholderia xenovorans]